MASQCQFLIPFTYIKDNGVLWPIIEKIDFHLDMILQVVTQILKSNSRSFPGVFQDIFHIFQEYFAQKRIKMSAKSAKLQKIILKLLKLSNQWLKMHLNCPPWLEKILKFTGLAWLKMRSNCPPWLEKILKFTGLEWLKMHSNCPPWFEKILKFTALE